MNSYFHQKFILLFGLSASLKLDFLPVQDYTRCRRDFSEMVYLTWQFKNPEYWSYGQWCWESSMVSLGEWYGWLQIPVIKITSRSCIALGPISIAGWQHWWHDNRTQSEVSLVQRKLFDSIKQASVTIKNKGWSLVFICYHDSRTGQQSLQQLFSRVIL